ncbi:hypothetical protein F4604DRAFT_1674230 [Suillus subluteus]|nr:hypothetical protein F4604DRAFT_1674230 [Suillus subluteus]
MALGVLSYAAKIILTQVDRDAVVLKLLMSSTFTRQSGQSVQSRTRRPWAHQAFVTILISAQWSKNKSSFEYGTDSSLVIFSFLSTSFDGDILFNYDLIDVHELFPDATSDQSPSEVQRAIRKKKSANDVQAAIPLILTESGPSTGSQPFPLTQPAQSNSLKTVSFHSSRLGVQAGTAIRFLKSKSALSSPPEFVSVSEADVLWRSRPHVDDPFTPEHINPWDSRYSMKPANLQLM